MIKKKEVSDFLANRDPALLERSAVRAGKITAAQFGKVISLYAPIYLSNYCENNCVYCGFRSTRGVKRKKLTPEQIESEMKIVAGSGIRNILLLTGESRKMSPVSYLMDAVKIAGKYFSSISLEVYPLDTKEYQELYRAGVDGVTIYQETYDRNRYDDLHLSGKKKDYDYRYKTPERIALSGIRMISMGILTGLSKLEDDLYDLFEHLNFMERNYPGVEYSVSFPRLIVEPGDETDYHEITDMELVKCIILTRLNFPRVGINLSTRENASLRDHALHFGITRISAASNTSVGGYVEGAQEDPQFRVKDIRSIKEIETVLREKGFDPVYTDWRRIENKPV